MCRYQQQLDQQLEMLQSERERVFEQFLQEKEMIDQAVRKIQGENEEAALKKMMAKKATQQQVMVDEDDWSRLIWSLSQDGGFDDNMFVAGG